MGHRKDRVGHEIQREVSELLELEARDPRLEHVTITGAEVTGDLRHAKLYFTTRETEEEAQALEALSKAIPFLRRELAKRLDLRFAPDLEFFPDRSIEQSQKLLDLFDQIHQEEEK